MDWEAQRDLITELIRNKRSQEYIIQVLNQRPGFENVGRRSLQNKLRQWNLRQNKDEAEMFAIVSSASAKGMSCIQRDVSFRTPKSGVTKLSEALRYFHRKKGDLAHNAFHWVHVNEPPPGSIECAVEILDDEHAAALTTSESSSTAGTGTLVADSDHHTPERPIALPESDQVFARLALAGQWYGDHYLNLPPSHPEPIYHMFSTHGRFGALMQDAVDQARRLDIRRAAAKYAEASSLLEPLVANHSPMALAQMLAALAEMVCSASRHDTPEVGAACLTSIINNLIDVLHAFASRWLCNTHPIVVLTDLLRHDLTTCPAHLVQFMRNMVESMTRGDIKWEALYVMERYCDCLWQVQSFQERYSLRARLLEDQTEYYGGERRNVLYTMTIVADDHLERRQPAQAETLLWQAFNTADVCLEGFDRAKIQFAALEGLARAEMKKIEMADSASRRRLHGGDSAAAEPDLLAKKWRRLMVAEDHLQSAVNMAQLWFGGESRRTRRAMEAKAEAQSQRRRSETSMMVMAMGW